MAAPYNVGYLFCNSFSILQGTSRTSCSHRLYGPPNVSLLIRSFLTVSLRSKRDLLFAKTPVCSNFASRIRFSRSLAVASANFRSFCFLSFFLSTMSNLPLPASASEESSDHLSDSDHSQHYDGEDIQLPLNQLAMSPDSPASAPVAGMSTNPADTSDPPTHLTLPFFGL